PKDPARAPVPARRAAPLHGTAYRHLTAPLRLSVLPRLTAQPRLLAALMSRPAPRVIETARLYCLCSDPCGPALGQDRQLGQHLAADLHARHCSCGASSTSGFCPGVGSHLPIFTVN